MNINHLNPTILKSILLDVIDILHDDAEIWIRWKENLPLLAVCSYWREILEPTMYGIVFAEYQDNIYTGIDNLHSNVELFTSQYLCNMATMAVINYNQANEPYTWNYKAIMMISGHTHPFLSVRVLKTESKPTNYRSQHGYRELPDANMDLSYNGIVTLAKEFTQRLPNISGVYHYCNDADSTDNTYTYVIGLYLPQAHIVRLTSLPIPLNFDHWSPKIVHMDIQFNRNIQFKRFPSVNSKSLQSLTFYRIPKNFTFGPFADAGQYNNISFTNLEALKLSYEERYPIPAAAKKFWFSISFPKLRKLEIHVVSLRCDVVYAKSFPKLKYLGFSGETWALYQLSDAQFGSLVHADLLLNDLSYNMEEFYLATNNLVKKMDTRFKTKLVFGGFPTEMNIANIEWKQLKSLVINNTIVPFDLVCKLLQKLSLLEDLCITELNASESDNYNLSWLRDRSDYKRYILNTRLERIDISICAIEDADAVSYLIICCPGIRVVSLNEDEVEMIYSKTLSFANQYPHLNDIEWGVVADESYDSQLESSAQEDDL